MLQRIFIGGASVRSAAQSARQAGLSVVAADLFRDQELDGCEQAHRVEDYPRGLLRIADSLPPMEWAYTGGLENEPRLVDAISTRHALLGNPGRVLRRVRNPWRLSAALLSQQLPCPAPERQAPNRRQADWLCKPLRSSGGGRVRFVRDTVPTTRSRGFYYQPFLAGTPHGALFVGAGGRATLLGVTRQLVGCRWAGARGFMYVGSVGPAPLRPPHLEQLHRIGSCLAETFELRGLFGIDAIIDDDHVWTVEVNPRFTASVEILERSLSASVFASHCDACRNEQLPPAMQLPDNTYHGKAIAYAVREFVVNERFLAELGADPRSSPPDDLADLPRVGTQITIGRPMLTVFAQGSTDDDVENRLRRRLRQIHEASR